MTPTLVILAAGIGSRYGGLKQMDPIGPSGEFLLDYGVYDAIQAGFGKLVFVIRREIERDFEEVMGARLKRLTNVEYVFQDKRDLPIENARVIDRAKPWGTGHAIWACRKAVAEPFAVINADDFYGRHAYDSMADFLDKTADDKELYGMVGFVLSKTLSDFGSVARGICTAGPDGIVKHIVETTGIEKSGSSIFCPNRAFSGDELVSMNFWGFKPSIFGHLESEMIVFLEKYGQNPKAELYIPSVVDKLIAERKSGVRLLETSGSWFGMTNPEDRDVVTRQIRSLIDNGVYPARLWE